MLLFFDVTLPLLPDEEFRGFRIDPGRVKARYDAQDTSTLHMI